MHFVEHTKERKIWPASANAMDKDVEEHKEDESLLENNTSSTNIIELKHITKTFEDGFVAVEVF